MQDKYNEIFDRYKEFIEKNSKYNPKIVKINTNTSSYFPIISCYLSDNTDTDYCTNDMIERYENVYITVEIYTKDKVMSMKDENSEENKKKSIVIASQIINDELSKLTIKFFGEKLGMKKTLNKPTPNLDTSVLRKTIHYQCLIGNVRGNIIRR